MKVLDFIVCDDVRQEVGNKRTLVGIYDAIQINDVPSDQLDKPMGPYRIAFYFRIDTEGEVFGFTKYGVEISSRGEIVRETLINLPHGGYILPHIIPLAMIVLDFMVPFVDRLDFKVILEDPSSKRIVLAVPHYLTVARVALEKKSQPPAKSD